MKGKTQVNTSDIGAMIGLFRVTKTDEITSNVEGQYAVD